MALKSSPLGTVAAVTTAHLVIADADPPVHVIFNGVICWLTLYSTAVNPPDHVHAVKAASVVTDTVRDMGVALIPILFLGTTVIRVLLVGAAAVLVGVPVISQVVRSSAIGEGRVRELAA